jgi:hypothetical protein
MFLPPEDSRQGSGPRRQGRGLPPFRLPPSPGADRRFQEVPFAQTFIGAFGVVAPLSRFGISRQRPTRCGIPRVLKVTWGTWLMTVMTNW